jgi:hypothetical protein
VQIFNISVNKREQITGNITILNKNEAAHLSRIGLILIRKNIYVRGTI